ncbi:MAG: YkgJ family cysteine cluster protein [Dehalococcoidia bacterium]
MRSEKTFLQAGEKGSIERTGADNATPLEEVEKLRREAAEGFLDAHERVNNNASKALETASFSYALIELLQEKGIISFDELNARQKVVMERLLQKFSDQGIGVMARQEFGQDKYSYNETVEIDCASRLHLCRAACCRLQFALSKQDIDEGIVKWDLGKPYMIAKHPDGYCKHLDQTTRQCTVWQNRPIPCRGYDCRQDERIWVNFEAREINPNLEELFSQSDDMTS